MSLFFSGSRAQRSSPVSSSDVPAIPTPLAAVRRTAGQAITTESAMRISAVWACVRLRADLISTLPIKVLRDVQGNAVNVTTPPVLVTPGGDDVDIVDWLYMSQVSLDLRGNSFGVIVSRDGLGYPSQIELQHPDNCGVRKGKEGRPEYRVNGSTLDANEVWHERAFRFPGSLVGLSPITYAAVSLGVALAAEQFGADWFADGAHPSSVLMTPDGVDQEKAKVAKAKFLAAIRGSREPVVLGAGLKYQPIQVAANESQFLDTQKWSVPQIARLFGIQPEIIGGGGEGGSSVTYANREQRNMDFLTFGFGPTIARRQTALTRLTPKPQYVRLNPGALLRTDLKGRYDAYKVGLDSQFLGTAEIRKLEDMPELDLDNAELLARKGEVLGALVRAGFDPAAAVQALGLDPMKHTGLVPVTVTTTEVKA